MVTAKASPSRVALQPFLDICAKLLVDESFQALPFEELAEAIRHTKASPLGPGGLPYEVWALCGTAEARPIYAVYLNIVRSCCGF